MSSSWASRTVWRFVSGAIVLGGVALLLASPVHVHAQERSLQGFVTSAETGQPLPGANVILQPLEGGRQPQGAAADGTGYYRIGGLSPGRYTLRATFVGYHPVHDTIRVPADAEAVTRPLELLPADQTLEEVVVTEEAGGATTQQAGRQQVTAEDIENLPTPSVSGDLTNYLQSLPGIVSVGDRGGQLFVRGGTPDQNLVLMDRMQVYRPFHIVGFYSAFPQELVSSAEIYAGGFPAKYSSRMSSVIDVQMRGGNQEHIEGGVTAGPFLTGLRMEGPLNDDGTSLLAAARFSQIERTAPTILAQDQPLRFNDQFVKVQNNFEVGRCSVTGLHTYDRGQIDPEANDVFTWSNYALGGRCLGFGSETSTFADVSVSFSHTRNAVGTGGAPERESSLSDIAVKLDLSGPLGGGKELRGGLRIHFNELRYTLGDKFQGFSSEDEAILDVKGYSEAVLHFGERVDLRPGIAVTLPFGYGLSLEPRLRGSWQPFGSAAQELNAAVGYYRQSLAGISDERDIGTVFTAWVPVPLDQGRPSAWHTILGWRQQLGSFGFTVEGYYKDLQNLTVPRLSAQAQFTTELTAAEGTSWGFDIRGEFERGPVYAYLGYGFSKTRYAAADGSFGSWLGSNIQSYHPPHDRRHELNAVLSARIGFLTADVRWQLGTGRPFTRPFGFDSYIRLEDLEESPRGGGQPRLLYEKPYRSRLPAYHRLDVSLERTFEWGFAGLTVKAGAINVYDRQNLFYFDLFTQRRVDQLPFIPYLALELSAD